MNIGNIIQSKHDEREKYIVVYNMSGDRGCRYLLISLSTGKVVASYKYLDNIKEGVLGEGSATLFDNKYDVFESGDLFLEGVRTKEITKEHIASSNLIGYSGGAVKVPKINTKFSDETVIGSGESSKYAGIKGCKYSIGDRVESAQFPFEHGVVTGIRYSMETGWLMQVDEGGWYASGWIRHLSNSYKHKVTLKR